MNPSSGDTLRLPHGEDPSWFGEQLRQAQAAREGPVRLTLVLPRGMLIPGELQAEGMGTDPEEEFESVYLEPPDDDQPPVEYPCRQIQAIQIH